MRATPEVVRDAIRDANCANARAALDAVHDAARPSVRADSDDSCDAPCFHGCAASDAARDAAREFVRAAPHAFCDAVYSHVCAARDALRDVARPGERADSDALCDRARSRVRATADIFCDGAHPCVGAAPDPSFNAAADSFERVNPVSCCRAASARAYDTSSMATAAPFRQALRVSGAVVCAGVVNSRRGDPHWDAATAPAADGSIGQS